MKDKIQTLPMNIVSSHFSKSIASRRFGHHLAAAS